MSSIEFECDCGKGVFLNSIDNRSYLAHYIADQKYDEFSGVIDNAIEKFGASTKAKEKACMEWRSIKMQKIWQCPACGTVYIEDQNRKRFKFNPALENTPKQLFKR